MVHCLMVSLSNANTYYRYRIKGQNGNICSLPSYNKYVFAHYIKPTIPMDNEPADINCRVCISDVSTNKNQHSQLITFLININNWKSMLWAWQAVRCTDSAAHIKCSSVTNWNRVCYWKTAVCMDRANSTGLCMYITTEQAGDNTRCPAGQCTGPAPTPAKSTHMSDLIKSPTCLNSWNQEAHLSHTKSYFYHVFIECIHLYNNSMYSSAVEYKQLVV